MDSLQMKMGLAQSLLLEWPYGKLPHNMHPIGNPFNLKVETNFNVKENQKQCLISVEFVALKQLEKIELNTFYNLYVFFR